MLVFPIGILIVALTWGGVMLGTWFGSPLAGGVIGFLVSLVVIITMMSAANGRTKRWDEERSMRRRC